jgi:valyl-tRNA synthetase
MSGRHRRQTHGGRLRIPEQRWRPCLVEIIDACTRVEHLVSDDVVAAHCHAGRYPTLCGLELLAASMAEPGRGRCTKCAR